MAELGWSGELLGLYPEEHSAHKELASQPQGAAMESLFKTRSMSFPTRSKEIKSMCNPLPALMKRNLAARRVMGVQEEVAIH